MSAAISILLVDDDCHLVESMADWLRQSMHQVSTASSLMDAKEQLVESDFDLVITDLRLGNEDGFDLIRHLRQRYKDTAVLVMTGYATPGTAVEAVQAGAFDLLTKPIIDDELLLSIQRAIELREIHQENQRLKQKVDRHSGAREHSQP